jgi:hypothetical protein
VRRRLLGLAVAVLVPAVIPEPADAQNTASGSVSLVIRADALPPRPLDLDSEAILWMAPESIEETERLTALWAKGDDAGALKAWRTVVSEEIEARRLSTDEQADAAAGWIATRTMALISRRVQYPSETAHKTHAEEIRTAAREAIKTPLESIE